MLGVCGKPKAGYTIHKETNYNVVSLVGHRNSYSQPGRPRRSVMVIQVQQNATCESRHGHLRIAHHWWVWIVLECGFHVKL